MIQSLLLYVKHFLPRLGISREKGQGLVEYGLIILLIALVVIGGLTLLGTDLNTIYHDTIVGGLPF